MTAVAPIARFALAYGAGVAVGLLSVPVWATLLVLLASLAVPIRASRRPLQLRTALVAAATAVGAWCQAEPGRELSTRAKHACIRHGRDNYARNDRPNTRYAC